MVTDKNYRKISDEVYKVDSRKYDPLIEGQIIDNKYKILKVEDNRINGMQAMAVAPVKEDGKVETGHSLGRLAQGVALEYNVKNKR